jgi:hypothetical protein
MKRVLSFLFAALISQTSFEQVSTKPYSRQWLAGFMTAGADASSFRHFLVLPNGTLASFAAGEKPEPFAGIDNVAAISAGTFHILALKKDGTVWAWGKNDSWQLGNQALSKNKNALHSAVPVQVTGIKNAIAVSAAGVNSYALLADGTVWAWGNGNLGMAGDGGNVTTNITLRLAGRPVPVQVKGITNAIAIAGPMALLADGSVMSWGVGYYGTLGNGTAASSSTPVQVSGIKNAVAIGYREYGAMALLADGTVWAWGKNSKGQLGTSVPHKKDSDASSVPVQVKGLSNVVAIDAHTVCLALLKDGTVKAWGWGAVGGMGSGRAGTNDAVDVPLTVPNVKNAVAVKSGNGYGVALLKDGTIMGWGADMVKEGVYHQTWTPVPIGKLEKFPTTP